MKIFNISNTVNLSDIVYTPKNNKINLIYLDYNYENKIIPFIIETPQLKLLDIFDINHECFTNELLLDLDDTTKNFINDLENIVIDYLQTHKDEIGVKTFKSLIKQFDDDKSINMIKLKLLSKPNLKTNVYDPDGNIITISDLYSNDYVRIIMQIVAIWEKDNVFGVYLRPYQIKKYF